MGNQENALEGNVQNLLTPRLSTEQQIENCLVVWRFCQDHPRALPTHTGLWLQSLCLQPCHSKEITTIPLWERLLFVPSSDSILSSPGPGPAPQQGNHQCIRALIRSKSSIKATGHMQTEEVHSHTRTHLCFYEKLKQNEKTKEYVQTKQQDKTQKKILITQI